MHIDITQPDDFHVHLRDDDALKTSVAHAAGQFKRITVMPNLHPPVTSAELALAYRARIIDNIPENSDLEPLMTLYLTAEMTHETLIAAKDTGIKAIKLYPQGVTTNSAAGVSDLDRFDDIFASMAALGLLLLIHGESSEPGLDIFERENLFIEQQIPTIIKRHPKLKIVLEHITTAKAAAFVEQASDNIAATITPQHLLANRNHLLSGGIKPHYYCLPILKTESDRIALLQAATSGNPKFFLGTDSAPHARHQKENACGCAGCYSMPYAIEYYAESFDSIGKIDRLSDFAGRFGAVFYDLPMNTNSITLIKLQWTKIS